MEILHNVFVAPGLSEAPTLSGSNYQIHTQLLFLCQA